MRKLLFGAALAVLAVLAPSAALAVGPNCTSNTITAFNAAPNGSNASATSGSYIGQTFSSGGPTSTIYTGANAQMAMVSWQITGNSGNTLLFQGSQDEGSTYSGLFATASPSSASPSGMVTLGNGAWTASVSGYGAARVTAVPTSANQTFVGTVTVYQCVFSAPPAGQTNAVQGMPFGFPLSSNVSQWNGASALLGPGPSVVPGQGTTPRFSLSRDANPRVILDDSLPTYRCSARFTPQATAAVTMISMRGSATSTVRIRKILLSGTSTALSVSDLQLQRTSALGAGGTTVSPTIGHLDTNSPGTGAGALCSHYTTTLKAAGTSTSTGGPLSTWTQFTDTVTTPTVASRSPDIVFPEGGVPGQSIVLRGTSDFLEIQNVAPTNLGAGTVYDYTIEWVEDSASNGTPAP